MEYPVIKETLAACSVDNPKVTSVHCSVESTHDLDGLTYEIEILSKFVTETTKVPGAHAPEKHYLAKSVGNPHRICLEMSRAVVLGDS